MQVTNKFFEKKSVKCFAISNVQKASEGELVSKHTGTSEELSPSRMPTTKTRKNRDKQAAKQQQAQLTNSTKSNKKLSKKSKNSKTQPITQPKDCNSGSTLSDWYTRRLQTCTGVFV